MLRINDWVKFYMPIPLLGAFLAHGTPIHVLLIAIIYLCLIGYAFVVNNYFDVEIDMLHRQKVECNKNPLANGMVSKRGVLVLMFLQVAVALVCSLLLSEAGSVIVALNLLLVTAYSASHIRLKERLGWDIITHGLMFGAVPFLAGFSLYQGRLTGEIVLPSLFFFVIASEALLAHQITEYAEDVKATNTTVTMIGQRKGLSLLGAFVAASLMILSVIAYQHQVPLLAVAVLACYLLVYPTYSCRGVFFDIGYRASTE